MGCEADTDIIVHYGQVTVGNYKLIKCLGSGAYGHVYKCQALNTGAEYALKIMYPPNKNGEYNYRDFLLEQRVYQMLSTNPNCNSNIVCLIDSFVYRFPFLTKVPANVDVGVLVIELMDGDITKRIYENLDIDEIISGMLNMLDGVYVLHHNGLAHRDIKPLNVMYKTYNNGHTTYKIADLGLACMQRGNGVVNDCSYYTGTPENESPDVAQGIYERDYLNINTRADLKIAQALDVWGLGFIFYIMLYKKIPFYSTSASYAAKAAEINLIPRDDRELVKYIYGQIGMLKDWNLTIPVDTRENVYYKIMAELIQGMLKVDHTKRWTVEQCRAYLQEHTRGCNIGSKLINKTQIVKDLLRSRDGIIVDFMAKSNIKLDPASIAGMGNSQLCRVYSEFKNYFSNRNGCTILGVSADMGTLQKMAQIFGVNIQGMSYEQACAEISSFVELQQKVEKHVLTRDIINMLKKIATVDIEASIRDGVEIDIENASVVYARRSEAWLKTIFDIIALARKNNYKDIDKDQLKNAYAEAVNNKKNIETKLATMNDETFEELQVEYNIARREAALLKATLAELGIN